MSDRYILAIIQTDGRGNDPQYVRGSLPIVIAALHEYTKYPNYSLVELTVKRDV